MNLAVQSEKKKLKQTLRLKWLKSLTILNQLQKLNFLKKIQGLGYHATFLSKAAEEPRKIVFK